MSAHLWESGLNFFIGILHLLFPCISKAHAFRNDAPDRILSGEAVKQRSLLKWPNKILSKHAQVSLQHAGG